MNIDEIVGQMGTKELRSVLVGEQELVKEGGNMFSDVTRINQENVAATLKYIYQELLPNLDIDRKNVQPLGSVGKKLPGGSSGDLDLGIDATKCDFLQDSDNLVKDLYEHCKPVLDDMGIECKMIPTLFSIRCPIQNFDGKQEGEFVQLDMMVTKNMKFQTWSNYADKEKEGEVYIKGAIRNLIFEAASHAMDKKKIIKTGYFKDGKEFVEGPIEWEEYSFFTAEGLNIKHVTLLPMTKQPKDAPGLVYKRTQGKDTDVRTLVSNDPDVIAQKMFGPKVKGKDLMTWKGAWDAAHNSEWAKDPEQWKIFLDSLREKIQVKMSAGFNIPDVMLDELGLNTNDEVEQVNEDVVEEGGSRFDFVTKINQKNARATMDNLMKDLNDFFGLDEGDIEFVGSGGKKLDTGKSGDLDVIMSRAALKEKLGVETYEEWVDLVSEFAQKIGVEIVNLDAFQWAGTSIAYPIENVDGEQDGEYVQVDLVPTEHMKFQSWSQHADQEVPDKKFVKTLVRNQIIEAVAIETKKVLETGLVNGQEGEQPVKWQEYQFDQDKDGLWINTYELPLMNTKKGRELGLHTKTPKLVDSKMVTADPDEICGILFGEPDASKFLNWDDAYRAAQKLGKTGKSFKDRLRKTIFKSLRRGKLPYLPEELQEFLDLDAEQIIKDREERLAAQNAEDDYSMMAAESDDELDSARVAMVKIHQLTGSKLRKFLQDFITGVDGSELMVRTTPKVDGQAYRIAWLNGKVMMELSKSGLLDKDGVKNDSHLKSYEKNFYEYNEKHNAKKVSDFIKSMGLDGIKVIGEILPNAEGLVDDNGTITYVGTTYDATKLGKEGTLVMFDVKGITSERMYDLDPVQVEEIKVFLSTDVTDTSVQFMDINKFAQEVELNANDFPAEILDTLRKTPPEKMKRSEAEPIRDQINASMIEIMRRKFKNPDIMPKDDQSLEGVVFELNGVKYGIHYQEWKDLKEKYGSEKHEMDSIIKTFLAAITDGNPNNTVLKLISPIRNNPEAYQVKYNELLPKFLDRAQELIKNSDSRTDIPRFMANLSKVSADNLRVKFNPELLTDDVMSFVELVDGKIVDRGGETIALIPGSFRPPHKGHFAMVKHYASIADQVIVGISAQNTFSSKRFDKFDRAMPGTVAQQIMKKYCDAAHLDNVEVSVADDPIKWVAQTIRHFKNCKIMLGLSKKDDTSRFSAFTSDKFLDGTQGIEILPIEDNAVDPSEMEGGDNISATYVRDHIDDKDALRKVLPSELNDQEFEEVFNLMNPEGEYVSEGALLDFGDIECTRMNQENAEATLNDIYTRFLPEFGLTKDDTFLVGSSGKKLLPGKTIGDIDLGVDQQKIMDGCGIETEEEFADKCQEVADKLGIKAIVKSNRGFSGTSFCWPISNTDGKQENEFVQVDFVVSDNLKFTKWSYHQDDEQEVPEGTPDQDVNPKGIVKTMLMQAIARGGHLKVLKTGDVGGVEEPVVVQKYDYDYRKGLVKITRRRKQKKNGDYAKSWEKNETEFVTGDPDEMLQILLMDDSIKADDISNPKKLWDALTHSELWRNPKTKEQIAQSFQHLKEQFDFNEPTYFKFNEGGHAKSDIPEELKARINQENVEATLDDIYKRLLPELGLSREDVEPVGSTGKKLPGGTSGDIDLAMDQKKVMEGCGVETPEEFIDHCQDVFAKLDVYDASAPAYGWKAVSCFWPIANTDGKQEGLYVQLDFVVTTNMRFVTWGYHSPQEQEVKDGETMDDINPKTAVKLILLRSIAMGGQMKVNEYGDVPGEGEHLPTDIETYEFVFNEGLYKIHKVRKQKKNGEFSKVWMQVSKEFVTDDPDEIVKRAFGDPSINADDLLTTRDMWDAFIDSPLYEDENKRHEIGNIFKKIMKRQEGKYGYPSWMKFD